ncbi:DinB family protein [bacterium]|nr:DinB family protein [bacterium]
MSETELLRDVLKSQYHAALAMLRQCVEPCPDDLWISREYRNTFWQLAYHTLFFTHLYIQPDSESFQPWEQQVSNVQCPDCIPGPPDPTSDLPPIPDPHTREQILQYWDFCDGLVNDAIDSMDILSPESGFWWYKVPKLEHQLVNIRHIQHGAAQLADRLRLKLDVGIDWRGAKRD